VGFKYSPLDLKNPTLEREEKKIKFQEERKKGFDIKKIDGPETSSCVYTEGRAKKLRRWELN
jgi:hypothetical protein